MHVKKPYNLRYIARYVQGYLCNWAKKKSLVHVPWYLPDEVRAKYADLVVLDEDDKIYRYCAPETDPPLTDADEVRYLPEVLGRLTPRKRQAITLYYLEGKTLQEAGKVMNLTRERVRQICRDAIYDIRAIFARIKRSEIRSQRQSVPTKEMQVEEKAPNRKWKVRIIREITHETEVEVDGTTSEEAREAAQKVARHLVFPKQYPTEYVIYSCSPV